MKHQQPPTADTDTEREAGAERETGAEAEGPPGGGSAPGSAGAGGAGAGGAGAGSGDGDGGSLRRRRRMLAWVVAGAVLLTGAGVALGASIRSPAQVAADAAPPPPSVLSDRVERRVLTSSVVVRGTVAAEQVVALSPGAGAAAAAGGGGKPVVTRVAKQPGAAVQAGEVLVEVSGRPVFALAGALPVYRDLKPGATGKDVGQLQAGLRALGHSTGKDPSGTYGPGTKAAVTALYTALGYTPRPADPGDTERIQAAEDAVDAAKRQVMTAKTALAKAKEVGGADTAEAQQQLAFAQADLAKAAGRLEAARAAAGPMVPADELVFLKGFPARVDAVRAAVGEPVPEGLLVVSAGAPVIRSSLPAHQRELVKPGMKVEVLSEATGLTAAGTVASVADAPAPAAGGPGGAGPGAAQPGGGADGAPGGAPDPGGYALTVTPDKALDARLAGQGVRLTVTAASSGEPVLVVPLSAVSAGADGRTTVTVLGADPADTAARRRVEVRAGMSADGMVQVEPVGGGALADGDRVLVARATP
ncbi:peptidoglycan-binding domain-containing protein [Streptomyces sp. 2P-4]|uniref:peptidoglycan-binding domain-containing protein n=1 Tax=Streptomyces sp. 2P-4 TaxID=2931974 RepID=UPI00254166CE|nr:peptidoglycan-binding domain-containing protein [Streptomyces sp. 2P-4]